MVEQFVCHHHTGVGIGHDDFIEIEIEALFYNVYWHAQQSVIAKIHVVEVVVFVPTKWECAVFGAIGQCREYFGVGDIDHGYQEFRKQMAGVFEYVGRIVIAFFVEVLIADGVERIFGALGRHGIGFHYFVDGHEFFDDGHFAFLVFHEGSIFC